MQSNHHRETAAGDGRGPLASEETESEGAMEAPANGLRETARRSWPSEPRRGPEDARHAAHARRARRGWGGRPDTSRLRITANTAIWLAPARALSPCPAAQPRSDHARATDLAAPPKAVQHGRLSVLTRVRAGEARMAETVHYVVSQATGLVLARAPANAVRAVVELRSRAGAPAAMVRQQRAMEPVRWGNWAHVAASAAECPIPGTAGDYDHSTDAKSPR